MRIVFGKKLAVGASLAGLLALGGGTVLADSLQHRSAQDSQVKPAATAIAAAANPDCRVFSATNAAVQRRVSTNNTPGFYTSTDWTNLQCGSFDVTVPRGKSALVVVKTDAEVTCTTADGADSQWCQARVLINKAEGEPTAPEPDSFAWSNSQTDANAWESNAFSRTAYLRCPIIAITAAPCTYPIQVQVKNHGPNLTNRVDDATVDASLTYF